MAFCTAVGRGEAQLPMAAEAGRTMRLLKEGPMLRLYVLRHAKSSWAQPGQKDCDRPLNCRGIETLERIREAIVEHDWQPHQVFCSPTQRTRLTLAGIEGCFRDNPKIVFEPILYDGDASAYLACLKASDDTGAAMLVGHNPMCEEFCEWLCGSGNERAVAAMATKFPTGAMAVFDIDRLVWRALAAGSGKLVDFFVPREAG